MDSELTRVLGTAKYQAQWIGKSLLVRLTASGILPCSNYKPKLEKRPEEVDPANWDMVFYIQKHCDKAPKPFLEEVITSAPAGTKFLTVFDAGDKHEVPIQPSFPVPDEETYFETATDRDEFVVYAKLPKEKGLHGCIVVPEDALVTAVHYLAFGPGTKAECDEFVARNCVQVGIEPLRGGEIPWPLDK